MNVLLVDDDLITHEIITVFLQRYGEKYEIEVTLKALHDPVQGLIELSDHKNFYHMILLDVRLPKFGGDQIYKSISKKAPELLDRIVFITASPNAVYEKLPNQNLHVLGKPFRYDIFESKIHDVHQHYASEEHCL